MYSNHVEQYAYDLPHNPNQDEFNAMMIFLSDKKVSDVTVQTGEPIWAEIQGRLWRITARNIQDNEIKSILSFLYGDNATSLLSGGRDLDSRYDIMINRNEKIGFRLNVTPGYYNGNIGSQLTLRTIPGIPPTLDSLGIEKEIRDNLTPLQGMVLVVGVTGSGKSTLLAAGMRHLMEHGENRKILTYEAPIEFIYEKVQKKSSVIFQTELPTHLRSEEGFSHAVRNALRRKPSDILIGEARDKDTVSALIEASLTGHVTYSTVHSDSVSNTISRLVMKFPTDARDGVTYDLLSVLRMIVVQKLLPSKTGGRVALREYLVFDKDIRDRLLKIDSKNVAKEIGKIVKDKKQRLFDSATRAYEAGLLDDDIYLLFKKEVSTEEI